MYFEEDKQQESGVNFIEMNASSCGEGEYCTRIIRRLSNNKNYVFGVSVVFQNNNTSHMSNRLVVRPTIIATEREESTKEEEETSQTESVQTKTPGQILKESISLEKQLANSQKIIGDFKESKEEQVASLFSYLAKNPINLKFKLS